LKSFEASSQFQKEYPEKHVINICDREGDVYDLFLMAIQAKKEGQIDLLVRSARNRRIKEGTENLHAYIEAQAPKGFYELDISRNGERKARTTRITIRFSEVSIRPPKYRGQSKKLAALPVWIVEAKEEDSSSNPICWKLLSTYPINDISEARRVIDWYASRWIIEEYFKVLKSGCKIEERQLQTFDRLEACLALDAILSLNLSYPLLKREGLGVSVRTRGNIRINRLPSPLLYLWVRDS
jgi:hypothetical protein